MRLVIHARLADQILKSIARDRPEFFGAFTPAFKPSLPAPWNRNEPSDAVVAESDGTSVHYDARGTKPGAMIKNAMLGVSIELAIKVLRLIGTAREDTNFASTVEVQATFVSIAKFKDHYRLVLREVLLGATTPIGLRTAWSWIGANGINDSMGANFGIPREIRIGTSLKVRWELPIITSDVIRIDGEVA